MNTIPTPYEDLLQDILDNGTIKKDRTGTGTLSVFGRQIRYDLSQGFPLITTKRVAWKSVKGELLWFISGDTNNNTLLDNGIKIWNDWRRPYDSSHRKTIDVTKQSGSIDNQIFMLFPLNDNDVTHLSDEDKSLYALWWSIIGEVRSNPHVTICNKWLQPQEFINDVKSLPQYWYKRNNNKQLNMVLYGNWCGDYHYSPNTAVWISHKDKNLYESHIDDFIAKHHISHNTFATATEDELKEYDRLFQLRRKEIYHDGDLGSIYGSQWRSWRNPDGSTTDQLTRVIETLKKNPDSRRMIVSAWNVSVLDDMALPPCHVLFQFYVANGKLSCQLYQRSADMFLGVPFNIASYSLLTHMIAQEVGLDVGEFIWTGGDCHIYTDHISQVREQISRTPRAYPTLVLQHKESIFDYTMDDIDIEGYDPHPAIKGNVSV